VATCPYAKTIEKLAQDVWTGDGKGNPSVTARLLVVEEIVARLISNSTWGLRYAIATFISALGALIMLGITLIIHFVGK
jgi:hypothetical protein